MQLFKIGCKASPVLCLKMVALFILLHMSKSKKVGSFREITPVVAAG